MIALAGVGGLLATCAFFGCGSRYQIDYLPAMVTSGTLGLLWWSARLLNQADDQQRQAEERVRASEEKFRALAHTAHEAIVSADSRGHIVYFNPGAEAAFGFRAARFST